MSQDLDKEYAGILGYEDFQVSAATLAFGKNFSKVAEKSVSLPESYVYHFLNGCENNLVLLCLDKVFYEFCKHYEL